MKRTLKTIFLLTLFLTFASTTIAEAATDISGHGFETDIRILMDKGIISGYADGTFRPNGSVTRAEFISMLVNTLGLTSKSKTITYADVSKEQWYYGAIQVAASNGLLSESPRFNPNTNITREEMAAFIIRAVNNQGLKGAQTKLNFADEAKIAPMFIPAIEQLVSLKIVGGSYDAKGNLIFAPKQSTTRGETAAILNRTSAKLKANGNLSGASTESKNTYYNLDYNTVVDIQAGRSPKVDGKGLFTASRSATEYYLNPANVEPNSSSYLQFLVLSENAGLNVAEVNEKILKGKGALEGQAEAFIEAGRKYNINEVYLIAHALHETGNGKSQLAQGVKVSAINGKAVEPKVTYNMFGIGAVDACPVNCGSKRAYEEGWFSPAEAIIGGAKFIGEKYVNAGQNTLYKMRWNPDQPGTHQYATHVMWAQLQTQKIYDIYQQLDTYTHKFDIPNFVNQPGKSTNPSGEAIYALLPSKIGLVGVVKLQNHADTLNLRSGPTTSFEILAKLTEQTQVTILGENGGWYKITVDGKTGWVSGDYITTPGILKVSTVKTDEVKAEDLEPEVETFDLND